MGGDLLGSSAIVQAKERSLSEGRGSGDRNRGHVMLPANTCNIHACQAPASQPLELPYFPDV